MDKLRLASASLGERLKAQSAQVGRLVSTKMKDLLQSPTPESRFVDDATAESLSEPNWGLNLRICAMINAEQLSGAEIVRTLKRRLAGQSVPVQRLALELLEVCAMNCDKVFSEVASEKVLEEMVRIVESPQSDQGVRARSWNLIRAWGESEDLAYLPVFRQTYLSLKSRNAPLPEQGGDLPPMQYSLESYVHQEPISPPEGHPIPADHMTSSYNYDTVEERKEYLVIARSSLELLSNILNSGTEREHLKDDLTVNMLCKCKESLPVVRMIIESTGDDEGMLFEALNLHDELALVISRCEELQASLESGRQPPNASVIPDPSSPVQVGTQIEPRIMDSPIGEKTQIETKDTDSLKGESTNSKGLKGESTESRSEQKDGV